MRYYDLVTEPTTANGTILQTPSGNLPANGAKSRGLGRRWTSFPSGSFDAQAQDIVFDLQISPGHTPSGGTVISVHGVSIEDLRQAKDFSGSALTLSAGMKGGMPLSANQPAPSQLVTATVFGAFGNWQGTEQTLDLVIVPSTYTLENPGNIVFNWQPGQSFESAITQTLKVARPNATITLRVNTLLMTDQPILHAVRTANGLSHFVHELTRHNSALGPDYPGVSLYFNGSEITVTDYSSSVGPVIALKFDDLIGQPTWLEPPTLTINTTMRADIKVGSFITLPQGDISGPGAVLTAPTSHAAALQNANQLTFNGQFIVTALRAVGQFRGLDADDWITVIQAVPAGEN
jgi:hypothetical protein